MGFDRCRDVRGCPCQRSQPTASSSSKVACSSYSKEETIEVASVESEAAPGCGRRPCQASFRSVVMLSHAENRYGRGRANSRGTRKALRGSAGSCYSDEDGSGGSEGALMGGGGSSLGLGELGEAQGLLGELSDLRTLELRVGELHGLDDVDALVSSRVTTGELSVHLGNSTAKGSASVLLVHVHIILSGEVLEDNTVVVDSVGVALEDLADGNDLTLALADLVLSLHLVPEAGTSEDGVLGEHSDSEAGGVGIAFARGLSADDPVLSNGFSHRCNSDSFDHFAL